MTDALLTRLTVAPEHAELPHIPFPDGTAPVPVHYTADADTALPRADVLVVCWTTAEAMATADVLTPGVHRTDWLPYAKDWDAFEPQLTGRSPAREEKCMAHYQPTQIDRKRVLVAKSELHLATDSRSAPIVQLWKQMIAEVQPKMVITTGTAGGIGSSVSLGDVLITGNGRFDCTGQFKSETWARQRFTSPSPPSVNVPEWEQLVSAVVGSRLQPIAKRAPMLRLIGDVITCDAFLFDDAENTYGLRTYDPDACVEEMDDMTLPLALEQAGLSVPWLSVRNASDPQIPNLGSIEAEKRDAAHIYSKFGYWTTVCSALACWAVVCAL